MSVNLVYNFARRQFASGVWNWSTLPVSAALVSAAYTPSVNDVYLSAIPSAAQLIVGNRLLNQSIAVNGAVRGVIPTYIALELLTPVAALVLYYDTGNPATSPLLYYTAGGIGFPFLAQGENFDIAYDQLNGGFFQV